MLTKRNCEKTIFLENILTEVSLVALDGFLNWHKFGQFTPTESQEVKKLIRNNFKFYGVRQENQNLIVQATPTRIEGFETKETLKLPPTHRERTPEQER